MRDLYNENVMSNQRIEIFGKINKKTVEILFAICYTIVRSGVWRSLVARTAGGREVAGSNPVAPIFELSF